MRAWRRLAMGLGAILPLAGCLGFGVPGAETIQIAPVPGVALPYKARAMVFASETDLARNLTIALTRYQDEQTKTREGLALANAAKSMLAKGFETVTLNDDSTRPQLVVKLIGKASWSRLDAKLKMGCGFDVFTADGIPVGTFTTRLDIPDTDYRSDLEPGFAQCLKKPLEDLLASPGLARLAGTGFRDPPPAAVTAWMRTLGPLPKVK